MKIHGSYLLLEEVIPKDPSHTTGRFLSALSMLSLCAKTIHFSNYSDHNIGYHLPHRDTNICIKLLNKILLHCQKELCWTDDHALYASDQLNECYVNRRKEF